MPRLKWIRLTILELGRQQFSTDHQLKSIKLNQIKLVF